MKPVEIISGLGGGGIKIKDAGAEFNYDMLDILYELL
jgi:hypothetical protein